MSNVELEKAQIRQASSPIVERLVERKIVLWETAIKEINSAILGTAQPSRVLCYKLVDNSLTNPQERYDSGNICGGSYRIVPLTPVVKPDQIGDAYYDFCADLQEIERRDISEDKIHKIAFLFAMRFFLIHPFADGNGHTADAIYQIITRRKYPQLQIKSIYIPYHDEKQLIRSTHLAITSQKIAFCYLKYVEFVNQTADRSNTILLDSHIELRQFFQGWQEALITGREEEFLGIDKDRWKARIYFEQLLPLRQRIASPVDNGELKGMPFI